MIQGINNSTVAIEPSGLPYQAAFHTTLIVLSVLTTAHNLLVIVVYNKERSLQTPTNFILSNLACIDLITGCLFLPLILTMFFVPDRSLQFATNVFSDFTIIGIVLSLTTVTYERYLNLCHPYKYPMLVTKFRVRLLAAVIWLTAAFTSLIPIAWSHKTMSSMTVKEAESFKRAYQIHSLILVIFFVISTAVSLYALIKMFCVVRRLTKTDLMANAQVRKKRERRVILVFLAMYSCLIICWTPMMLVRLSLDFHVNLFSWKKWNLELFLFLRGLPSFINPLIYVWCKQDFRRTILKFRAVEMASTLRSRFDQSEHILMEPKDRH